MILPDRIRDFGPIALGLADELGDRCKRNAAILAEMDPENTLDIAGHGIIRFSLAGLKGESFNRAIQMMLADRNTSVDNVLALIENERQKAQVSA